MKVLVLFSVLSVTIFILLQHVSSISTLDKETYDLFVQLIKEEFTVPVKSRTVQPKSALVRFWRNREEEYSVMMERAWLRKRALAML